MQLTWLPNSQNGLMVGDYIATAFSNGVPHGVFAVAAAKSGTTFNEAMNTAQGLKVAEAGPQLSSAGDKPLHKLSDVIEKEIPAKGMPPAKRAVSAARSRSLKFVNSWPPIEISGFFCGRLASRRTFYKSRTPS
jgi:hypothetical protein